MKKKIFLKEQMLRISLGTIFLPKDSTLKSMLWKKHKQLVKSWFRWMLVIKHELVVTSSSRKRCHNYTCHKCTSYNSGCEVDDWDLMKFFQIAFSDRYLIKFNFSGHCWRIIDICCLYGFVVNYFTNSLALTGNE